MSLPRGRCTKGDIVCGGWLGFGGSRDACFNVIDNLVLLPRYVVYAGEIYRYFYPLIQSSPSSVARKKEGDIRGDSGRKYYLRECSSIVDKQDKEGHGATLR